ncbi:hypothetical protein GF373_17245 [bacterium]|nr:hypothetical protein [bacterium]
MKKYTLKEKIAMVEFIVGCFVQSLKNKLATAWDSMSAYVRGLVNALRGKLNMSKEEELFHYSVRLGKGEPIELVLNHSNWYRP